MEGVQSEGVTLVGEVISRTMREAITDPDFTNTRISAAKFAYEETLLRAESIIAAAGPYDDTRAVADMVVWLKDRIRAIHDPNATNGIIDGHQL